MNEGCQPDKHGSFDGETWEPLEQRESPNPGAGDGWFAVHIPIGLGVRYRIRARCERDGADLRVVLMGTCHFR